MEMGLAIPEADREVVRMPVAQAKDNAVPALRVDG